MTKKTQALNVNTMNRRLSFLPHPTEALKPNLTIPNIHEAQQTALNLTSQDPQVDRARVSPKLMYIKPSMSATWLTFHVFVNEHDRWQLFHPAANMFILQAA